MRRTRDPASDLRSTVATLQKALDAAHERVRDNERIIATMNERLSTANERADETEMRLFALMEQARYDAPERAGATPAFRDVSG